jgi:hypothetical protein
MSRMIIVVSAALALTFALGVASRAAVPEAGSTPPTVACDRIIDRVGSGRVGGKRIVLGVVSVPRAYIPQTVATGERPWRFWSKAGLVIRGGGRTPVSVAVPEAWRNRVAISWGNTRIVSSLRIARCPPWESKKWNAYAGGFLLKARSACLPLIFRVGQHSATVRFGVGRMCPPS